MSPKLLIVVGTTGNQGGSVANYFLGNPSWKIRGITRDPAKASARAWSLKGVEMVQADLDDVESLTRAFAGANAIFALTDYWVPMADENSLIKSKEEGIVVNEFCHNLEVQRGKNLAVAAAGVQTLERYVYSSLSASSVWSKGKYPNVWHFDSKAAVQSFIQESPQMQELAAKSSFLHVGFYLDNWKHDFATDLYATKDKSSGKWFHAGPGDGETKIPFIWVEKDVGVLVDALLTSAPGKTLLGYSQYLTWKEYMATWAKHLGVELLDGGFQEVTWNEVHSVIPIENLKLHLADSAGYTAEFGWCGGDPTVLLPKDVSSYVSVEMFIPVLMNMAKY